MSRPRLRRTLMGLATSLGLARRGYFLPYRYACLDGPPPTAYPALEPVFRAAEPTFREALAAADGVADGLAAIADRAPPPAPRWCQDWFPGLDAAVAYALVRRGRPSRIVEIGSGHSTRFLARAIADGGLATRLVAIDPAPRASLAGLAVEWHRTTLQAADPCVLAGLAAGDVLFLDSSHLAVPGSDVDRLVNGVLPTLPAGALVHIHDIFLPDGYPAGWTWRGYNEQLVIAALLQGGAWQPVFASRYVRTRMADALSDSAAGRVPVPTGALESSLWLRRRET